jgi:2'-5' RNA ligase
MVALVPPPLMRLELKPYCSDPDRLHLTIASLGEIDDLAACRRSVASAAYLLDPISLSVEGLGYIPVHGGQHACAALIGGIGLDTWRYKIAEQLRRDRVLVDERNGFLPHMTLCRGTGFFDLEEFPAHWPYWYCKEVWLFQGWDVRMRFRVGGA